MTENTIAAQDTNTAVAQPQEDTHEPNRYISPAVDIYENGDGLVVVADLPGLEKDDIEVSTEKDVLTLKGAASQSIDEDWTYREFAPVGYFRQFRLGNKIDQGKISAEYKHGVLHLKLPFAEEVKPRSIQVKVG